jgi:hypothetical protein
VDWSGRGLASARTGHLGNRRERSRVLRTRWGAAGIVFRLVTEPAYVSETRTAYDIVAELLRDALDASPWDRAILHVRRARRHDGSGG